MKTFNKYLISPLIAIVTSISLHSSIYAQDNFSFFFKNNSEYNRIKVKEVLSVNKIRLENNEIVKLIGLKPPEDPKQTNEEVVRIYGVKQNVDKQTTPDSIEQKAYSFAYNLLFDKYIRIEFDIEQKDEEFHTLGYVFLSDSNIFANEEILQNGYSNLSISPPNTKYQEVLRKAYIKAKKEQLGIHNEY